MFLRWETDYFECEWKLCRREEKKIDDARKGDCLSGGGGESLNGRVVMELEQYLLNFILYMNHLRFLLKCKLWFYRSRLGSEILHF